MLQQTLIENANAIFYAADQTLFYKSRFFPFSAHRTKGQTLNVISLQVITTYGNYPYLELLNHTFIYFYVSSQSVYIFHFPQISGDKFRFEHIFLVPTLTISNANKAPLNCTRTAQFEFLFEPQYLRMRARN